MAGPTNPSTNDECGLLVEEFDSAPCFMMPYNPLYYPRLLEGLGCKRGWICMPIWWKYLFFDMIGSTGLRKRSEARTPASGSGRSSSDVLRRN